MQISKVTKHPFIIIKFICNFLFLFLIPLLFDSCKTEVNGPIDVNVDQQNRGTIIGKVLINLPYQDENAQFTSTVSNADIRFTTGGTSTIKNTSYRTTSSSSGDFLIEVPAGSYNVYGYYRNNYSYSWGGRSSVTVTRGSTVNMGELKLSWQEAYYGAFF